MNRLTSAMLPPDDLLRDRTYRRLWTSILISSFGGQLTLLAVPLTAALLLHASPTQMAWLTATEISAFILLSLPAGVWLDRVHKLPVYVAGESLLAVAVAAGALGQTVQTPSPKQGRAGEVLPWTRFRPKTEPYKLSAEEVRQIRAAMRQLGGIIYGPGDGRSQR